MNYLAQYEGLLLKNAAQINGIESSLRTLTYILPGRFNDAEFASQALYAALNLLSLYHNAILRKAARAHALEAKIECKESAFNKYTNFWTSRSRLHKYCSTTLSVIGYTQVLMEIGVLKRWGRRTQWRWIALLEAVKVVLRLTLFRLTSSRMNLYPTHMQRDVDPVALEKQRQTARPPSEYWKGERTGVEMPRIDATIELQDKKLQRGVHKFADVAEYLMSKVLTADKVCKPEQMVHVMNALGKAGEILYILRPLLYVGAMLHYGRTSWKPWLLSLVVEVISHAMVRQAFEPTGNHRTKMTVLERQEYARRIKLLWFNLLRGAFYIHVTRPRLERYCNRIENKPILSMVAGVLREYLPLWQSIYFYTSSS